MKKIIIFSLLICSAFCLNAQDLEVTLRILSEKGRPMQGVSASVPGSVIDLVSDANGIIKFSAEKGAVITLVKYNEYARRVAVSSSEMTVTLDANSRIYGLGFNEFTTKETSSAAVEGMFIDDVADYTQPQVLNTLYGMIPGLQVYQGGSSSWPSGNSPSLNVRGRGSYSGNSVLVLVDGVQRDPSTVDAATVQSVSVLKDAASLALYGIRGADGAVLITTKRGSIHPLSVKTGYSFGVQTPFRVPQMASASAYATALNEARVNDGLQPYFSESSIASLADGTNTVIPSVNWQDHILRNVGFNNDASVTIDGGTTTSKYYVYADFRSNRGFFNNTKLTDNICTQSEYYGLNLRSNLDISITKTTDLLINLSARIQQNNQPQSGTDLSTMYDTPSAGIPIKYNNRWVRTTMFDNPIGSKLGNGYTSTFQRMLSGDVTIRQNLSSVLEGLNAEVRVAYDNSADIYDSKSFSYSYYNISPVLGSDGCVEDYVLNQYGNDTEIGFGSGLSTQYMQMSVWAKLNWERTFGKHHINASAFFNRDRLGYTGANNTYIHHDYVLTANYDYAGKYLASVVLSESASSKLSKGDKFRFYPAASVGWVLSKESFLESSSVVDFLKLRASFGLTGMDASLAYDMDKQFNSDGGGFIFVSPSWSSGSVEGALGSIGVTPELDYKGDVGVEFALLQGLTGEVDAFYNRRVNLRSSSTAVTSGVLGISSKDSFEGQTTNSGVELSLGYEKHTDVLGYFLRGNVSYAKNKVDKYNESYHPDSYQYYQGNAIGQFYGLVSDGYYQASDFDASGNLLSTLPVNTFETVQPGDIKYKDLNNDNKIDGYDYSYQLKSSIPQLYYGVQVGFDYKGFGFTANFQGMADYTASTTLSSIYQPLYGNNKNISKHYLESYWTASDPSGRYPRLTTLNNKNNYLSSDLWTEDGGFLKLRELQVYYNFPKNVVRKLHLSQTKVFLRGNNLFSIDNIKILDPEMISKAYPQARTYSVGFNVFF